MSLQPVEFRGRVPQATRLRAVAAQMDVVAGRWDDMAAATVRLAELVEELADDSPEEAP